MVLFMEGGCDWARSNVFFFAKVSLLVTMNLAVLAAWKRPPAAWGGLLPHFALLGLMTYVSATASVTPTTRIPTAVSVR
jgi:cytochrome c oxidase subunit IV